MLRPSARATLIGRAAAVAAASLALAACGAPDALDPAAIDALLEPLSGGALTVHDATHRAFSLPAANLESSERARFFIGNAFFNSPWVVAPASAAARDGLGPLFNARSCDACHNNDGRGRPPLTGERPVSLVLQLGIPGVGEHGEPLPEPSYGNNLNPFAIDGISAEGTVRIDVQDVHGEYADGTPYGLEQPIYVLEGAGYGPFDANLTMSPRVAPAVIGAGLLEQVPETQILEYEDPDDRDGDGISGRANRVWDLDAATVRLGRFGWKANQPDIAQQTGAAFFNEIGMTTPLFMNQNCMPGQARCRAAPTGGGPANTPEISAEIFTRIRDYQRMLAVPVRRDLDRDDVREGGRLFLTSGCAACHRPTFTTGALPDLRWLSNQTIHPFTDLLLHDMGPALADGRADFLAGGAEWRTPSLWGLGLQKTVAGHTRLLHDGRARDAAEAILWHGGEAERARERFRSLAASDRAALLAFLDSL